MIMQEEYSKKDAVSHCSGRMYKFRDNAQLFEPSGKGEPTYIEQRKYKNGVTVSRTNGKTPLDIVKLKLPANSPDPFWDCVRLLEESLPPSSPREGKEPKIGREWQTLCDHTEWHARLNHKTGKLVVKMTIDLKKNPIYREQLFTLQHEIYKEVCSPTNEDSMKSAIQSLQKSGKH